MSDVSAMGIPAGRMRIGGNLIWTLRASARLKRPGRLAFGRGADGVGDGEAAGSEEIRDSGAYFALV